MDVIRSNASLGLVGMGIVGLLCVGCGGKPDKAVTKAADEDASVTKDGASAPTDEAEADASESEESAAGTSAAKSGGGDAKMVAIPIKLPKPAFQGTPKNIPPGTTVRKPTGKPRGPFLAPSDCKNVAADRPISASDEEPIIGELDLVTDGDKEAADGSYVELGPSRQYAQIDLGAKCEIYAIVLWHFHSDPRVYRDVVVQLADDADFITDVQTVFNNDHDNSSGLGIGKDYEYFEVFEGNLIDTKGAKGKFVRLYSNGSTADDMNHYTEVEVWGRPTE